MPLELYNQLGSKTELLQFFTCCGEDGCDSFEPFSGPTIVRIIDTAKVQGQPSRECFASGLAVCWR